MTPTTGANSAHPAEICARTPRLARYTAAPFAPFRVYDNGRPIATYKTFAGALRKAHALQKRAEA